MVTERNEPSVKEALAKLVQDGFDIDLATVKRAFIEAGVDKNGKSVLAFISPGDVEVAERFRKTWLNDYTLVDSIKMHGLIQPIAVMQQSGPDKKPYLLLAGQRRLNAFQIAFPNQPITAHIYTNEMTELEKRMIELAENGDRKQLEYHEEIALKKLIHEECLKLYGQRTGGAHKDGEAGGWSYERTAALFGESKSNVHHDIVLAEALEAVPQLKGFKDKGKAWRALEHMKRQAKDQVALNEVTKKDSTVTLSDARRHLIDAYQVGDFFELVKTVSNDSIDLIEVDPPYGINIAGLAKGGSFSYDGNYEEVESDKYCEWLSNVVTLLVPKLSPSGWLLLWTSFNQIEASRLALVKAGLIYSKVPALWIKGTVGQATIPKYELASNYEHFWYARKSASAEIRKQGRQNIFVFNPIFPKNRTHPVDRPIALMEEVLSTFKGPNSIVYVPFAGSGSTILAASNQKMVAFGCDIGQTYKAAYVRRVMEEEPGHFTDAKTKGDEVKTI